MPELLPPTLLLHWAVLITDGPVFTHASLTVGEVFFKLLRPHGMWMRLMIWVALQLALCKYWGPIWERLRELHLWIHAVSLAAALGETRVRRHVGVDENDLKKQGYSLKVCLTLWFVSIMYKSSWIVLQSIWCSTLTHLYTVGLCSLTGL